RRRAARAPRGARPALRRAVHDRSRAAEPVECTRGRARRRASPVQLPRVVERRPGLMPPKPGPPPRQIPRRRVLARRFGALTGLVLAGLVAFALVKVTGRSSPPPPPPPTTLAAPRPFRIVFPEGFSRI